ncbi:YqiA/YcfP family alpha/beta fold hydrolase [Thiohalocapsa sp. ML1]|jgi:uncharacterized protein|uniref:YqiA/YcfP family alpha/beta fold hydrolase n=1 Tax=Thiohalocapsa sp. ML1 TaxID=1431688 RepID=UPI0007323E8D|nr:YqiA/YcfP family alpha/beta fold hydrolase [Thiohalocapsa sp. ML1]
MIVYLHGLNSSSLSAKATRLRELLAPRPVLAPDYAPHRPDDAVAELTAMLEQVAAANGPPVLVGSSMGGFYGRWLITRVPCAHLFMINPALRPWLDLRDFIGSEQQTAAGERYVLTRERIDQTRAYTPARPCAQLLAPTTLLVDLGDELIDQRASVALYRGCARVVAFPGGDHAFQHLDPALPLIRAAADAT